MNSTWIHQLIRSASSNGHRSLATMAETVRPEPDVTENRTDRDQEIGEEVAGSGEHTTGKLTDDSRDGDEEQTIGKDGDEKPAALSSSNGSKAEKAQTGKKEEKAKPSKFKEMWGKLGLDLGTCLMMFK